jgi:uncharacterized damage-inducible protein DinB
MDTKTLVRYWGQVRQGLLAALDRLHDEQLAFAPADGLWSLGETAVHVANAEDGWFRHIAQAELQEWPRVDLQEYRTVKAVKSLLTGVHDRTLAYLETLTEAELGHPFETSWGATITVDWIIWHIVEHEIHHRGEIYLMLGLMGLEAPDV